MRRKIPSALSDSCEVPLENQNLRSVRRTRRVSHGTRRLRRFFVPIKEGHVRYLKTMTYPEFSNQLTRYKDSLRRAYRLREKGRLNPNEKWARDALAFADEVAGYAKKTLIVSGILAELYPEVLAAFQSRGFREVTHKTIGEWTTGYLCRA